VTVVVDPRWPNERLARVGQDVSYAWLTLNGFSFPDRVFLDPAQANAWRQATAGKDLILPEWSGVHLSEKGVTAVALNLSACLRASRFRMFGNGRWVSQAPGSFEDYTPYGVFCHEVGHHVDYSLHSKGHSKRCGLFLSLVEEEEEVSGFEYNVQESFAEAIRLFVTNPDLLRVGRPLRWDYLTKVLRLKPLHAAPWRRVLSLSAKRVRASVPAWMEAG
jgi:hypothetical protein